MTLSQLALPYSKGRVLVVPFLGVGFGGRLVPLRAFSLTRFTPGAFAVRFRGLGPKSETEDNVLFWNWGRDGGGSGDFRPGQRKRIKIPLGGCDEHPGRPPGNDSFRFLVDCAIASTKRRNGCRVNYSPSVYSTFHLMAHDEQERSGLQHTIAKLFGITTMIILYALKKLKFRTKTHPRFSL